MEHRPRFTLRISPQAESDMSLYVDSENEITFCCDISNLKEDCVEQRAEGMESASPTCAPRLKERGQESAGLYGCSVKKNTKNKLNFLSTQ